MGHSKAVGKVMKKYPMISKAILDRHNMYNAQRKFIFEQEKLKNAFVICPQEPLHCSTLNVDEKQQRHLYSLGYYQGLKCADKVKEFIKY
jgi:predicted patatin/cPLA2 family phospholipase